MKSYFLSLLKLMLLLLIPIEELISQNNAIDNDSFNSPINEEASLAIINYAKSLNSKEAARFCDSLFEQAQLDNLNNLTDFYLFKIKSVKQIAIDHQLDTIEFKTTGKLLEYFRKTRQYRIGLDLFYEYFPSIERFPLLSQHSYYNRAAAIYNELWWRHSSEIFRDSSIYLSNKAIAIAESLNRKDLSLISYLELGNLYQKDHKPELVGKYLKMTLESWDKNDSVNYANSIRNYANFLLIQKQYDSTIYYMEEALNYLKNSSQFLIIAGCYSGIKKAYYEQGDSLPYLRYQYIEAQYMHYNDQFLRESEISELDALYKSNEKELALNEKTISLNEEKNKSSQFLTFLIALIVLVLILSVGFYIIRNQNKKLKKLNEENRFLVSESNHRIKNNLQLINSLIRREVKKEKVSDSPLANLSEKINSIATLHQLLYLESKKDTIAIHTYINQVAKNFDYLFKANNINLELQLDETHQEIDKVIYLGLLITELFTNSIKHAFLKVTEKKISVSLQKKSNFLYISYQDNGSGLPPDSFPELVNLLVKQLKANVLPTDNTGYSLQIKYKI